MTSPIVRFAARFTVYSIVAHSIAYTAVHELAPSFILALNYYAVTALFYFFIVLYEHKIITSSEDGNPQKFVRNFMAAAALKLFLYFGVLIIWVLIDSENAAAIIVSIVIIYFLNTIFDTFHLSQHFKKRAKKAA